MESLEPYQERSIALICRTDRRSAKADGILARAGFADVHIVRGGMAAWLEAWLAGGRYEPLIWNALVMKTVPIPNNSI